jgi:hypothetical protein
VIRGRTEGALASASRTYIALLYCERKHWVLLPVHGLPRDVSAYSDERWEDLRSAACCQSCRRRSWIKNVSPIIHSKKKQERRLTSPGRVLSQAYILTPAKSIQVPTRIELNTGFRRDLQSEGGEDCGRRCEGETKGWHLGLMKGKDKADR